MVIRRFDCILEKTKHKVLQVNEKYKKPPLNTRDVFLRWASSYEFYNIGKFTFTTLLDAPNNIESNFNNYLQGFSSNARGIIEKYPQLNLRQRDILINALRNPNKEYEIALHRGLHQIAYAAARADFIGLAECGLMESRLIGKKSIFIPVKDILLKLQD